MTDKTSAEQDSWHYTEDTLKMLSVSVAQIQSTLNDGGESVDELTSSFVDLAETFHNLMTHKTDIDHTDLVGIRHQIEHAIVAFQFYDRISQRLDHVSNSLMQMSDIIADPAQRQDPEVWQTFQQHNQAKLTMESERQLFADILNGVPIDEAIANTRNKRDADSDDSIELF